MEAVQFVCEFFFCNFWHWLGLAIIVLFAGSGKNITNIVNKENETKK